MLDTPVQIIFYGTMFLALLFGIYRSYRGPHFLDRLMCLDYFALILMSTIAFFEATRRNTDFFDVILVLSVVGFLTTAIIGKYLEKGEIVE